MRTLSIALLSILLAASTVVAGFTLKSGMYRMGQLDAAKSEALSGKKSMAFLFSDENTLCIQCTVASQQAIETLAGICVMVYVDKYGAPHLPDTVKSALRSSEAGTYIPKVVVMSYDLKKVIAIVPFARGEAYRKLLAEAKEKVLSYEK